MSQGHFGNYSESQSDPSSRRRLIFIMIGVTACLLVAIYAVKFLPPSTPYDDLVRRLEPGMTAAQVDAVLGKQNRFNWEWGFDDGAPSAIYRVNGTNLPLIIKFRGRLGDPAPVIDKWCALVPEKEGRRKDGGLEVELVCHEVK